MTSQPEKRVLCRIGARELKQEEIAHISGGSVCSFTEHNCTFVITHPTPSSTDVIRDV